MDYLKQNSELSEKRAADFKHPYELLMEKRRRERMVKSIEWNAVLGNADYDHVYDDIYKRFIECEINSNEAITLMKQRHSNINDTGD